MSKSQRSEHGSLNAPLSCPAPAQVCVRRPAARGGSAVPAARRLQRRLRGRVGPERRVRHLPGGPHLSGAGVLRHERGPRR